MGAVEPDVEIYVGGDDGWVPIRTDVRQGVADSGGGITITRGRAAPGTVAAPGTASLVIDNTSGAYSSRNPRSPYFGRLGRNTPVRIALPVVVDDFGRAVSGGWGTADSGQAWDVTGGTTADFAVAGGTATIAHPTTNVIRWADLAGDLVDVEQVSDIATSAAVTGAALVTGHIARYNPITGDSYWFRLEFNPGGSTVTLKIAKWFNAMLTELVELADVPGVTYTAGQLLRLRSSVVDGRLSMRVWDPDGPEPVGWHLTTTDTDISDAGRVGIMTWVVSGNTNSPALTVAVDAYRAVDRRAVLEVPSWPPRWTVDGSDVWTTITAQGVLERLSKASRPLRSPLYRAYTATTDTLIAYYPLEDGRDVEQAASGLLGGAPITDLGRPAGVTQIGTGDYDGSLIWGVEGSGGAASLVGLRNGGRLSARLPASSATSWTFEFVIRYDAGSDDGTNSVPMTVQGGGYEWSFLFSPAGTVTMAGGTVAGVTGISLGASLAAWDGQLHHIRLDVERSGADSVHYLWIDGEFANSGTWAGFLAPVPDTLLPNSYLDSGDKAPAIGHLALFAPHADYFDEVRPAAARAWVGETAGARLARLGAEQGVPMAVVGDPDATAAMGPQGLHTWYDLVSECATVDGGILGEARETLGLAYRTRASLYNQDPILEVDYTALAPGLEPEPDTFAVTNDVTASRPGGGSARAVLETGSLSVQDPPDGIGTGYDTAPELNVAADSQLRAAAHWLLHLGTWDEERYPAVPINLRSEPWASDPEATGRAAALDAGRVLSIDGLPDWMPPGPIRLMVQGVTEVMPTNAERTITYTMEPAGPYTVGVASQTTRVDTAGSVTTADFDAGVDTALTVQRAPGTSRLWITTASRPGDFPFDVLVSGVRLTVTGITSSSDPQTMTVTATPVNGITKVVPAGSAVRLADPWRVAR
jgi:hypothetical protein